MDSISSPQTSDTIDATRYYNRAYPYYEREDGTWAGLEGTTRTAPEGFTLDIEENYIQDDTGANWLGAPAVRRLVIRGIDSPDELFDATVQELKDVAKRLQDQIDERLI